MSHNGGVVVTTTVVVTLGCECHGIEGVEAKVNEKGINYIVVDPKKGH